jgi:membrane-bound lytic murein transglycosylase D
MRVKSSLVTAAVCIVLVGVASASPVSPSRKSGSIPFPPGLEVQVQFWKDVFTIYSSAHVAIHDRDALERVYSVLDFSYLEDSGVSAVAAERMRRNQVQAEIERVRAALLRIHQLGRGSPALTTDERRIADQFSANAARHEFREAAAADRLRAQTGLSDKFREAIETGYAYWPEMERIFEEEGLPIELTRLPLVESGFNLKAYSRTGAAGIWQFMPATGKLYLRIDEAIDERRDPIAATRAAARHLRENYDILGTWPLAVTAYNHGRGGMARAVAQLGTTDLVRIIQRYDGRSFGFASKNFYAEFLAALETERNAGQYFNGLRPAAALTWHGVVLPHYVRLAPLAAALAMSPTALADINPALSSRVRSGDLYIPKGYRLWLPANRASAFPAAYAKLSAGEKHAQQRRMYVVHRVRSGETLGKIARRYGTTVTAIMRQNGLRNANQIRVGQVLRISGA